MSGTSPENFGMTSDPMSTPSDHIPIPPPIDSLTPASEGGSDLLSIGPKQDDPAPPPPSGAAPTGEPTDITPGASSDLAIESQVEQALLDTESSTTNDLRSELAGMPGIEDKKKQERDLHGSGEAPHEAPTSAGMPIETFPPTSLDTDVESQVEQAVQDTAKSTESDLRSQLAGMQAIADQRKKKRELHGKQLPQWGVILGALLGLLVLSGLTMVVLHPWAPGTQTHATVAPSTSMSVPLATSTPAATTAALPTATAAPQPTVTAVSQPIATATQVAQPVLSVSPAQTGENCANGAWPNPITVTNSGTGTLTWQASGPQEITLTPNQGSLDAGQSSNITLSGNYLAGPGFTVTVASNGGQASVSITCQ